MSFRHPGTLAAAIRSYAVPTIHDGPAEHCGPVAKKLVHLVLEQEIVRRELLLKDTGQCQCIRRIKLDDAANGSTCRIKNRCIGDDLVEGLETVGAQVGDVVVPSRAS